MLKIYGGDLSGPSNKVRFVANYLNLPYEYQLVSIRDGDNRKPEYLKLHPAGKIPAIDDGGFVLFESNAIIRYLSHADGAAIYPADPQKRAVVDQWVDFVSFHVGGGVDRVLYNRVFVKFIGVEPDERSVQDGLSFLGRFLPIIEAQLNKHAYVAGPDMTLADFCLLSVLDPVEIAGIDVSKYPAIVSWRKKLKEQEFYTKCFKAYGERLKQFNQK
ncbi:MAG: glutathione S-transferase family protein [Candidatus Omnitrophota bacterium]|nr:glutathione S-transferase family protein [Candidatus Omnitrophota bacterium]MDZ4241206.1 glutathione S-transferase family protein [Candidatus Omnitrophota bacterium]